MGLAARPRPLLEQPLAQFRRATDGPGHRLEDLHPEIAGSSPVGWISSAGSSRLPSAVACVSESITWINAMPSA
jgi:hypothetical protein